MQGFISFHLYRASAWMVLRRHRHTQASGLVRPVWESTTFRITRSEAPGYVVNRKGVSGSAHSLGVKRSMQKSMHTCLCPLSHLRVNPGDLFVNTSGPKCHRRPQPMGTGAKAQSIHPRTQCPSQCRCFLRGYTRPSACPMRRRPKQ